MGRWHAEALHARRKPRLVCVAAPAGAAQGARSFIHACIEPHASSSSACVRSCTRSCVSRGAGRRRDGAGAQGPLPLQNRHWARLQRRPPAPRSVPGCAGDLAPDCVSVAGGGAARSMGEGRACAASAFRGPRAQPGLKVASPPAHFTPGSHPSICARRLGPGVLPCGARARV